MLSSNLPSIAEASSAASVVVLLLSCSSAVRTSLRFIVEPFLFVESLFVFSESEL